MTSNPRHEFSQTPLTDTLKMTHLSEECKSKFCTACNTTTGPQWAPLYHLESGVVSRRGTVTVSVTEREKERVSEYEE